MTQKLEYFNEKLIAEKIHSFIIQLEETLFDDKAKSPIIGYKRKNQKYKYATLQGESAYQSLVLHVDPGTKSTLLGKDKQKEIQKELVFDISKIRSHYLKTNEVYIPLEKLNGLKSLDNIKSFIYFAYNKQEEVKVK